jgi:hypothetical protein
MSAPSLQPLFPNPTVLPEKNNVKTINTVMTPRGKIPLGKEYNKGYIDTDKQFKHGAKMSETVIPSSARGMKDQNGVKFVNSRQGGESEHKMTKNASIKHENPEYFKRQADRKNADSFGMKKMKDSSGFEAQRSKIRANHEKNLAIHENKMKTDPSYRNQPENQEHLKRQKERK